MATQLTKYEAARNALKIAVTVDEVKDIRDKAEAMAAYARQAKDVELITWATEIKVRAERRAGQMLAEMPKAVGAKGSGSNQHEVRSHDVTAPNTTLADLGVTKNESSRWQKLAAVTDEQFESAVAAAKDVAGEVTTAAMLRAAKVTTQPESAQEAPPKPQKPKLLSEEESARILAENARLQEVAETLAADAQSSLDDNMSMAKIFEADDRLAAAMQEIERLRAEVVSLRSQLVGVTNEKNSAIRTAKSYKAKCERLEKQILATGQQIAA